MSRRAILVTAVLCVFLLLGGCRQAQAPTQTPIGATGSSETPSPAAEPSTSAAAQVPTSPAKLGDELTAGPWGFSVSEVYSKQEAPGMVKPAKGKEFMYVQVWLSNNGTATLKVKPADFSMKDSSGATVKPFGKRQAYNAYAMTPLEPKYGTNTAFIYEVTPDSTGYTFTFAPEVDGEKVPVSVTVR